jgi:hypothetical protein
MILSGAVLDILVLLREELVARAVCPGPYDRRGRAPSRRLAGSDSDLSADDPDESPDPHVPCGFEPSLPRRKWPKSGPGRPAGPPGLHFR